jgi:hypothetical protein
MTGTPIDVTQTTRLIARTFLMALAVGACGAPAFAQTPAHPVFFDINLGFGAKPSELTTGSSFSVFGEDGSSSTVVAPGASAMFDVRLGYRLSPHLGIAGGMSGGQSKSTGATSASVPSPIRFASPTMISLEAPELNRRELGYHIQVAYIHAFGDSTTVTVAGGPTFMHLQQGVPSVTVSGTTPAVVTGNESGTGVGANAGVDVARYFSDRIGVGVFARYAAATVDLPSAAGVKAGGFQGGGGVRIRF